MRIAIASGKGGTGKTTVATNLAQVAAADGRAVAYLDCDVEEPNGHLFLKPTIERQQPINKLLPVVDLDRCTFCGRCSEVCRYGAIACVNKQVLIFAELCHSCGGCVLACPVDAMREVPKADRRAATGHGRPDPVRRRPIERGRGDESAGDPCGQGGVCQSGPDDPRLPAGHFLPGHRKRSRQRSGAAGHGADAVWTERSETGRRDGSGLEAPDGRRAQPLRHRRRSGAAILREPTHCHPGRDRRRPGRGRSLLARPIGLRCRAGVCRSDSGVARRGFPMERRDEGTGRHQRQGRHGQDLGRRVVGHVWPGGASWSIATWTPPTCT